MSKSEILLQFGMYCVPAIAFFLSVYYFTNKWAEAQKDKNNLGVGAAAGLGELIVLNGKYYVADAQGNAKIMKPNDGISYLTATHFNSNQALEFQINKPILFTNC